MDPEPNEETGDSTNQGTREPTQEKPQYKLRDLRPEKDPMGAGRNRLNLLIFRAPAAALSSDTNVHRNRFRALSTIVRNKGAPRRCSFP